MAKILSESGTILYLKSIIESARSIKKLRAIKNAGKLRPYCDAMVTKISPETSSIIGYCMEILLLQKAHFPPRNIHEKSGILCQGFSLVLHE